MRSFIFILTVFISLNGYCQSYEDHILFLKVQNEFSASFFENLQSTENDVKQFELIRSEYGLIVTESIFQSKGEGLQHIHLVQFSGDFNDHLITLLSNFKFVDYVERVPKYDFFYTPNDLLAGAQYNLTITNAEQAWDLSTGNSNVVIAMVDDAVLLTHEDLANKIWVNTGEIPGNFTDDDLNGYIDDVNGWDAADWDNDPNPPPTATTSFFSHGTHCAGIAAAETDNALGVASMGFGTTIMPVKIATDPTAAITGAYLGVDYAIANNADVISMSWGGGAYSSTYQLLFDAANSQGIVCVAAAGNSNTSAPMYPAAYNHVISVGSTDSNDFKSGFSNYGSTIDVMAPGSSIFSTTAGNSSDYGTKSGTSMACPLVAGLAALMLDLDPSLTPDSLEICLESTCDSIDALNPGYSGQLGAGRINAYQALLCTNPITALFDSDYTQVCPGGTVQFTDLSTNSPTTWEWSFPGGVPSSSILQNPNVTYASSGTYDVELIATNTDGSDTLYITNYINVAFPTATMSGGGIIIPGFSTTIVVDLTGNPPWYISYTDGSSTFWETGITTTPYYIPVSPSVTTTYTLLSVDDATCSGTFSGSAIVDVSGVGSLDTTCITTLMHQKISDTEGAFNGVLNTSDYFGQALREIGDLNGDGVPDLVVGAGFADDGGADRGAVFVLFMNPDGTVASEQRISDTAGGFGGTLNNGDGFGVYLGTLGDMNGDGTIDLAINGRYADDGGSDKGALWLLFMNPDASIASYSKISETVGISDTWSNGTGFGSSCEPIGDLDGDGNIDVIVAGTRDTDGGSRRGALWVLFMDGSGNVLSHQKISDIQGNFTAFLEHEDYFGLGIANLGDIDGDGITDIAVGTRNDDDGGFDRGAVYILFLNTDGTVQSHQKISSTAGGFSGVLDNEDWFGADVQAAGDMNGDGITDIIVGAPKDDDGGTDQGAVWILLLNSNGTVNGYQKISETTGGFTGVLDPGDNFGWAVESISDLNGDGMTDFAVGSKFDDDGGSNHGAVWILFAEDTCNVVSTTCNLTADFTNTLVCVGDTTFFTDLSVDLQDSIIYWEWIFGDGDTVTGIQNPAHLYPASGSYTATLIVGNDASPMCLDSITLTVDVIDTLAAFGMDTTICVGDSVQLNVDVLCGDPIIKYYWSPVTWLSNPNISNPISSPPGTTTYTVMVVDSDNDTTYTTVTVTIDPGCCVSHAEFTVSPPYLCLGDTAYFTNTSIAQAGATYNWDFGPNATPTNYTGITPPGIMFDTDGVHTITLILNDICGADTFTLDYSVVGLPIAFAGNDTILCNPDSITLGGLPNSDYTYLWNPAGSLDDANLANPTAGITGNQSYIVQVIDNFTGCVNYDTIDVTLISFTVDLGPDSSVCNGDQFMLDATTPGATYLWYDATTGNTNTVSAGGSYWVDVTVQGCTESDTVEISIIPLPVFDLGSDTLLCVDDTLVLSINISADSYLWSTGSTSSSIAVTLPGTYYATATEQGCSFTDSIVIDYTMTVPVVDLGPDTLICENSIYVLSAGSQSSNYLWQDGSTDSIYSVSLDGSYYVNVTNACGTGYDTVYVATENCNCEFWIPNVITPNQDYSNDLFCIIPSTEYCEVERLLIYNRWGQLLFEAYGSDVCWDGYTSDGVLVPEGTYYYIFTVSGEEAAGAITVLR